MKRISRGPVRGISLKPQQEEDRKHRMEYVAGCSWVGIEVVQVGPDTRGTLGTMEGTTPSVISAEHLLQPPTRIGLVSWR